MQDLAIEMLGLSSRSTNCLRRAKISYLSQLMSLTEEELGVIRNMGTKSIWEVLGLQRVIRSQYGNELHYEYEIRMVDNYFLPPEEMLINKAFPEFTGQSFEGIMYRDGDEIPRKDIPIERLVLSARTTNALLASGY